MKRPMNLQCWKEVGIHGNRSCRELSQHIHCRNCPSYEAAGRTLLDRAPPGTYVTDQTSIIAAPEIKEDVKKQTALIFRLGPEWLALPAGIFAEITPPRPIRPVPHRNNRIFLGLTCIRGTIQLCFSLGSILEIQPLPDAKKTAGALWRFCVLAESDRQWVFPADEIHGLHHYAERDIQPAPVTVAKALHKYTAGIVAFNKRQAGLLNENLVTAAFQRSLS